jgi:hypothetical protein
MGEIDSDKDLTPEIPELIENVDFYFENGLMVLSKRYLLKRGYCCGNECRHCPYGYENVPVHKR